MTDRPVVGIVGTSAGGVEELRARLIAPLLSDGFGVAVTLTPTAAHWLGGTDEIDRIEEGTGFPVRSLPRRPDESSPHPRAGCFAVVPATANSVAKIALGVADNQAMTVVCEALGLGVPIVVFPRINAAHARHPAWEGHIATLGRAGVDLVYGHDVWPLREPRAAASDRELPWAVIGERIRTALSR